MVIEKLNVLALFSNSPPAKSSKGWTGYDPKKTLEKLHVCTNYRKAWWGNVSWSDLTRCKVFFTGMMWSTEKTQTPNPILQHNSCRLPAISPPFPLQAAPLLRIFASTSVLAAVCCDENEQNIPNESSDWQKSAVSAENLEPVAKKRRQVPDSDNQCRENKLDY